MCVVCFDELLQLRRQPSWANGPAAAIGPAPTSRRACDGWFTRSWRATISRARVQRPPPVVNAITSAHAGNGDGDGPCSACVCALPSGEFYDRFAAAHPPTVLAVLGPIERNANGMVPLAPTREPTADRYSLVIPPLLVHTLPVAESAAGPTAHATLEQYSVPTVLTVLGTHGTHSTRYSQYSIPTVLGTHGTRYPRYSQYSVPTVLGTHGTHSTRYSQYSVHTVLTVDGPRSGVWCSSRRFSSERQRAGDAAAVVAMAALGPTSELVRLAPKPDAGGTGIRGRWPAQPRPWMYLRIGEAYSSAPKRE